MRLIGDVHGKYDQYVDLALASPSGESIQLGDLGFKYWCLEKLDPQRHKVLAGNHDNYGRMNTDHWLGDFGTYKDLFFVRGGRSIDRKYRTEGVDFWSQEELRYYALRVCEDVYAKRQPEKVLSHECPSSVTKIAFGERYFDGELLKDSLTSQALEAMLKLWRPKLWVFGHHHRPFDQVIGDTRFVCLPELGVLDL